MTDAEMTGPDDGPHLVLEAGDVRVVVLPGSGGRLGSVIVAGHELLVTSHADGPRYWGSYPMVPWAGRVRHGRFTFEGVEHQLPISMPPHAIHGVAYDRAWEVIAPDTIAIDLDERWPFRGRVTQRFALDADGLTVTMMLDAAEPQPVVLGWHPWFRRVLAPGTAPVTLDFRPGTMLQRDEEGIPTGALVEPPAGPWDDCFTAVQGHPTLEWPGLLRLSVSSTAQWWVVYDLPVDAVCVEPQSGPPDGLTIAPEVARPGTPFEHTMRWSWERLGR